MGVYHPADSDKGSQQNIGPVSRSKGPLLVLNSFLSLGVFVRVIFNLAYVYLAKHGAKAYRVESAFYIFSFFALFILVIDRTSKGRTDTWELKNVEKRS